MKDEAKFFDKNIIPDTIVHRSRVEIENYRSRLNNNNNNNNRSNWRWREFDYESNIIRKTDSCPPRVEGIVARRCCNCWISRYLSILSDRAAASREFNALHVGYFAVPPCTTVKVHTGAWPWPCARARIHTTRATPSYFADSVHARIGAARRVALGYAPPRQEEKQFFSAHSFKENTTKRGVSTFRWIICITLGI